LIQYTVHLCHDTISIDMLLCDLKYILYTNNGSVRVIIYIYCTYPQGVFT